MATGKTLGFVLGRVLGEIGMSTQAALNQDARETLKAMIADEQEQLIDDYDWLPFINTSQGKFFDTELAAGQRYYDWPSGLDYRTIKGVWYLLNGTWLPLNFGVSTQDYSAFSSEDDERADPVQKWDFHTEEQFEVWPLPLSVSTVRFQGRELATAPVAESNVCVIDHIALTKFAAASWLRAKTDETGESRRLGDVRYAEGMKRINTLKARKNKHVRLNFTQAGRNPDPMDPRFRIRVAR